MFHAHSIYLASKLVKNFFRAKASISEKTREKERIHETIAVPW